MTASSPQPPRHAAALGVAFGIGLLWLLMAALCAWSAARGYGNQRFDWALLWGLVALLLAAAGIGAMVGTWRHLSRSHDDY